jgi:hypothetical protein
MKGVLDAYINTLFDGLRVHAARRVEHLIISVPRGSGTDLERCFRSLVIRIVGRKRKSLIQYAGILVGSPPEHGHVLWVKPYVRYNVLTSMWADIIGSHPAITSKTVRGDKSKRNEMRRLVYYLVNQSEHHDGESIRFIRSARWTSQKVPLIPKGQSSLGDKDG